MNRRSPRPAQVFVFKGHRGARILAVAALAGAVLALSGCQLMSPRQTTVPYQPADGVAVDLGDVHIRDLVVIAGAKGGVGTLSAMVVNDGTAPVTLTFGVGAAAGGGGSASAEVPAGTQTRLSGVDGTTPITLPDIPAAPGGTMTVTVSTPAGGAPEVSVPVLLPDGYYSDITPAPTEPTATPEPTQTAAAPEPTQTSA